MAKRRSHSKIDPKIICDLVASSKVNERARVIDSRLREVKSHFERALSILPTIATEYFRKLESLCQSDRVRM